MNLKKRSYFLYYFSTQLLSGNFAFFRFGVLLVCLNISGAEVFPVLEHACPAAYFNFSRVNLLQNSFVNIFPDLLIWSAKITPVIRPELSKEVG